MIRLLILILALNTFMVPASAARSCGVMDGSNNSMSMSTMSMSSSKTSMIDMDMSCEMPDGTTCSSIQCVSSCSAAIIPLPSFQKQITLIVAGRSQYQTGLAYFYTLILPVNTPPPLV